MIDNDTYIVRVQGYRYLAAEDFPETVLRTYIEVLKFPGEMDVLKLSRQGTELIGYLCQIQDMNNINTEFRDVPRFIPADDQFCNDKRATYHGDAGFQLAQQELEALSKANIVKGIKRYLIKDYLRTVIVFLQMHHPSGEGVITLKEVEFFAGKAPDVYESHGGGNYFQLNLTADEDDKTTAYYMLLEKYEP
jgi:hypothetical protein